MTFLYIFLLVDCFKWALIDHKIHLVTFLYIFLLVDCFKWALIDCNIHLVTFLYIFWLVYCFKWALIDQKIHLVTFPYIFLLFDCVEWVLIDCIVKCRVQSVLWQFQMGGSICLWHLQVFSMHWYFLISSYYLTVLNGHSLTILKSIEVTQCSGSFKWGGSIGRFTLNLPLVSSLAIFDCFKWALIDHIEKHRGHSAVWQFWMGGVNWQIYPKSANFELTCHFMLCFTEGLFVLHTKDLISQLVWPGVSTWCIIQIFTKISS